VRARLAARHAVVVMLDDIAALQDVAADAHRALEPDSVICRTGGAGNSCGSLSNGSSASTSMSFGSAFIA
jgi:hypothetical protein